MDIDFTKITNRFAKYISFNTQANDHKKHCPSSPGQMIFAKYLADELAAIGLTDITLDANGYLMATLPANGCLDAPVVGFISHMDTSPDMAGSPIQPRIIENYDGGDIILNKTAGIVLKPAEFPELTDYINQEIMVTDGLTLLGADDKAGICAIISAAEYLLAHPEIKHGKVRLGFTPDEEIGRSADLFDVKAFAADFAYTVDGGAIGSLEFENFNAANIIVKINGRNVHPGSAKGKMLNAIKLAAEWQQLLPNYECPECTSGYEGFYHINNISGNVESVTLTMLVRDHSAKFFAKRKLFLQTMADLMNEKYGNQTIDITIRDHYHNMRDQIEPVMHIVDLAKTAMQEIDITPVITPIRGGTDGARLSFKGLPCPNIFTGGLNFHGKFEFLPLRSLQKSAATVAGIIVNAAIKK